jgi:outer membrane autotransporter protein
MLSALVATLLIAILASVSWAQTPAALVRTADTPPQTGAALVIAPPGGLCRQLVTQFSTAGGGVGDLRNRCTELVQNANRGGQTTSVQNGLEQMAGVETTALGGDKVKRAIQFGNISARLAALRGGATGLLVKGRTLEPDEPLPGPRVASISGTQLAAAPGTADSSDPATSLAALGRLGVFLNGSYSWGDVDATDREAGFDFDAWGFSAGVDYRLTPSLVLGAAFGYTATSADYTQNGGKVDVDDFAGSLYGTYYVTDKFYVDGILSFGYDTYSLSRRIVYSIPTVPPGTGVTNVNQTAQSDPDGYYFAVGVAGSYDFNWGALTVGPIARLNYLNTKVNGYTETISGTAPGFGLGLDVQSQTIESLTSGVGLQATYAINTPIGVLLPQVAFEWQYEFLDNARPIKAHFINDPTPSSQTTISWDTDNPDRNFFNIGAGVTMTFARGIAAYVYYETILGLDRVSEQRVAGGVRVSF